jgi:hypothetical protein
MPYIKQYERDVLSLGTRRPKTAGELNFKITKLAIEYLGFKGESYQTLNEIIGVLECAKQEFYRRVISGYEDKKITENGDVY